MPSSSVRACVSVRVLSPCHCCYMPATHWAHCCCVLSVGRLPSHCGVQCSPLHVLYPMWVCKLPGVSDTMDLLSIVLLLAIPMA